MQNVVKSLIWYNILNRVLLVQSSMKVYSVITLRSEDTH